MVKDHSDSERGNPLPPHGLLFWARLLDSIIAAKCVCMFVCVCVYVCVCMVMCVCVCGYSNPRLIESVTNTNLIQTLSKSPAKYTSNNSQQSDALDQWVKKKKDL